MRVLVSMADCELQIPAMDDKNGECNMCQRLGSREGETSVQRAEEQDVHRVGRAQLSDSAPCHIGWALRSARLCLSTAARHMKTWPIQHLSDGKHISLHHAITLLSCSNYKPQGRLELRSNLTAPRLVLGSLINRPSRVLRSGTTPRPG
jgi:hypothetical protein